MLTVVGYYSGIVLEKVAEYFYYNYVNRDRDGVKDMDIPPELCLELLMAADYLDSKSSCPPSLSSSLTCYGSLNQPFFSNELNVMIYDRRRNGASGMEAGVQQTAHTS